jgi:hypothetical protein
MALVFEAIGGVLLALPDAAGPDQRSTIENTLLLAWLAAAKAGPAQPSTLTDTLGKIGWTISSLSNTRQTLALPQSGAAALDAVFAGAATAISNRLAASQPDPVIAAWWGQDAAGRWLAVANPGEETSLTLCHFDVAISDDRVLIFGGTPEVVVTIGTTTGVLNPAVFAQVETAVADKVKPYLADIVRG